MKENNIRRSVIGGLFWKFGERIMTQGVSFVVSLILARILSPDDYGVIALAMTFMSLAAVFINSGFATALIQKKDADSTDFSTIFYCSLACSALIYGILFVSAPAISAFYRTPELTPILRVMALQIPISVYNSVQLAYISRHMLFRKVFVTSTVNGLVSGAVGIGMAMAGFGVWALVAQNMMATVANSVMLTLFVPWRPELKFSWKSAKGLMNYGSKILLADLSGTFFYELRGVIIGRVYTTADLAFYNKGQHLPYLVTSNLSNIVKAVLFPAFANQSDNMQVVRGLVRRCLRVMAYIIAPCMLGMAAVMEPLILFLFTEKWEAAIDFGRLVCIGLSVSILGDISLQVLKAIGRSDVVLGLEIKKKPVYVLLLILGVRINVLALAAALVIYDFYSVGINLYQLKKHVRYPVKEMLIDLLPPYALSAAMALAVYLIPSTGVLLADLVVKVAAGVLFYVAASTVFKMDSFLYLKTVAVDLIKRKK